MGRARVTVAPGSVPFGEKGTLSCVRVRELPADLLRVQGTVDGVRSGAWRFVAVDAWLDDRAVVWCSRWSSKAPRASIISPR